MQENNTESRYSTFYDMLVHNKKLTKDQCFEHLQSDELYDTMSSQNKTTGLKPLHLAIQFNDISIAQLMLGYGAIVDINEKGAECGQTPLHKACWRGSYEHVELLLAYKANPCCRDSAGYTPLHIAAQKHPHLIPLLLKAGADNSAIRNWVLNGRVLTDKKIYCTPLIDASIALNVKSIILLVAIKLCSGKKLSTDFHNSSILVDVRCKDQKLKSLIKQIYDISLKFENKDQYLQLLRDLGNDDVDDVCEIVDQYFCDQIQPTKQAEYSTFSRM